MQGGGVALIVCVIDASLKVFRAGLFHFSQRSAMVTQGLNHYGVLKNFSPAVCMIMFSSLMFNWASQQHRWLYDSLCSQKWKVNPY